MKLNVLGSSGAEFPGRFLPAFLLDGKVMLDAGTIASVLDAKEQWKIRNILLTHAHLDHTRGIPFLADNIVIKNLKHSVNIYAIPQVIKALRENLLNGKVWPDFTAIPSEKNAVLRLKPIEPEKTFSVNSYEVTAFKVTHSVPATGFLVKDRRGRKLLYTGDTGPSEGIWKATKGKVDCLIIEVSMPNRMENMAVMTGHLTANLLKKEIAKMAVVPKLILVSHMKPQYLQQITKEVMSLRMSNVRVLSCGDDLTI